MRIDSHVSTSAAPRMVRGPLSFRPEYATQNTPRHTGRAEENKADWHQAGPQKRQAGSAFK
ncbi:hypothetical protein BJF95_04090 [Rhizobium oryziradicis]|uniref:Uncharacterized protein n=1 Tax=Rhizobium oryziradicis TaxID=1867956 RepID=A0A1Q8ZWB1_9HYPH|nr:hypothetical protein BJF95_04090 [Rhizobium oryziradicis]